MFVSSCQCCPSTYKLSSCCERKEFHVLEAFSGVAVAFPVLTLSLMTNLRLFQTERVARKQF